MAEWTPATAAALEAIRAQSSNGSPGAAREALGAMIMDHASGIRTDFTLMQEIVTTAFLLADLPTAQRAIALHFHGLPACSLDVAVDDPQHVHLIVWHTAKDGSHRFTFCARLFGLDYSWIYMVITRWVACLRIANQYDARTCPTGKTYLDVGDWSSGLGLCFSDNLPDALLIPDSSFLGSAGYQHARTHGGPNAAPWSDRRPSAIWRGSSTGEVGDGGLMGIPRVALCRRALEPGAEGLLDAGITAVVQAATPEDAAALESSGLCRPHVSMVDHSKYKYQVDIDGNTNSWPGLFQKLLTGSPVLKILSPKNYRQWYYPRLVPWHNYVPVATDMSDLMDIIRHLQRNDDLARAIGAAGRLLADEMTLEAEIQRCLATVGAAFSRGGFTSRLSPANA